MHCPSNTHNNLMMDNRPGSLLHCTASIPQYLSAGQGNYYYSRCHANRPDKRDLEFKGWPVVLQADQHLKDDGDEEVEAGDGERGQQLNDQQQNLITCLLPQLSTQYIQPLSQTLMSVTAINSQLRYCYSLYVLANTVPLQLSIQYSQTWLLQLSTHSNATATHCMY